MRLIRGTGTRIGSTAKLLIIAFWMSSVYFTYFYTSKHSLASSGVQSHHSRQINSARPWHEYTYQDKAAAYDKSMPLVFIGGMPRSGTTLMRTMLDAHPDIRCGQETRIIPRILGMRANWLKSAKERNRLEEAGVTNSVINDAITQFILEVIVKHGHPAKYLCNKDPFTLKSSKYLRELFPNAKFILMLRDGRATAHSIISRKVTISGFDINSYRDVLNKWNRAIESMYSQCQEIGQDVCLPVRYEQLVLQPMAETRRILAFLEIPYNPAVLHHEKYLSNISLSNVEKSTDQVQRPLYLDALSSWFGNIPQDVARDMAQIAPMLRTLGYDPNDPHPKYGEPDELVLNNTRQVNPNVNNQNSNLVLGDNSRL
ncbi:protein-tyrosine sulfotransferase 1-like [Clavelina lepadiformis]|uniref:Protein-tyrosine sulfotransferase n=1 Tax=Clavelina lepadiformis TaxID=159417 RepID=A0ABP0GLJ0_CLALP